MSTGECSLGWLYYTKGSHCIDKSNGKQDQVLFRSHDYYKAQEGVSSILTLNVQ